MRSDNSDAEKFGLIEELELSEPAAISRIQVKDEVKLRVPVELAPGNASSPSDSMPMETREMSQNRVRINGKRPLLVGDVYQLRFDSDSVSIADTYALCVGCRLLPDRDYEVQLEFFSPVDLAGVAPTE